MAKKHVLIAILQLILTLSMLTMVFYAWFSLSDRSTTSPFEVQITSGISYSYKLTYYTQEAVYQYDPIDDQIKRYDTSTGLFVTSSSWPSGYHSFTSFGIFINQYDPLLSVNNTYNNIIVEMRLELENDAVMTFTNSFFADASIAAAAVSQYGYSTSRPYYASEVVYVQQMISNQYINSPVGTNLYTNLTTQFSNTTTYPRKSFYGTNNTYNRTLALDNITAITPNETIIIYYNFSYFESKIASFLTTENIQINVANMPYILFYQDIKIQVREVNS